MNPSTHTYIAWHCTKCDHRHVSSTPVSSYPVKCPSCGEQTIRLGHPVLPTNAEKSDENARLNRIEELKASIVSNLHELKLTSQ